MVLFVHVVCFDSVNPRMHCQDGTRYRELPQGWLNGEWRRPLLERQIVALSQAESALERQALASKVGRWCLAGIQRCTTLHAASCAVVVANCRSNKPQPLCIMMDPSVHTGD